MGRLSSLLREYNSGAHDIDKLLGDLVELARDLTEEEGRAVKEGLTEEELAIFDLLQKDNLNPDETEKVRKVAKDLWEKLQPRLSSGWKDFEPRQAGVKTTISDVLYSELPEPTYDEKDCEIKGLSVYNFIYEHSFA